MARYKALVAGATGIVGYRLTAELAKNPDWDVVAIGRSKRNRVADVPYVSVDMTDRAACEQALGEMEDLTHIFYSGRAPHVAPKPEPVEENLSMLRNVVEPLEPRCRDLQHIHVVHGTKWYGSQVGPFKTPAKEDDSRTLISSFYYAQQDWVADYQLNKRWGWSTSRPHGICDFAPNIPRSMTRMICVYAAISKELGLPLKFPGSEKCFGVLYQCTDAAHLARAIMHMGTTKECQNEAYNVINGDYIRWCNLWPGFAAYFGMEDGGVQHVNLVQTMADKGPVWDRIVEKHGLQKTKLEEVVNWPYGDFIWNNDWDTMSSINKLRKHGFTDTVDTEEMFYRQFDELRAAKIVP